MSFLLAVDSEGVLSSRSAAGMAVEEVFIAFGATAIASGDGSGGGSVVATSEASDGQNASFSLATTSTLPPRCPAATGC